MRRQNHGCGAFVALAVLLGLTVWIYILNKTHIKPSAPPAAAMPEPEKSTAEKLKLMCDYLHARYDDKPITEIPMKDLELIGNCKALGLW
jgi:hypothetical protein